MTKSLLFCTLLIILAKWSIGLLFQIGRVTLAYERVSPSRMMPGTILRGQATIVPPDLRFTTVKLSTFAPTTSQFLLSNPAQMENSATRRKQEVLYIADRHKQYGTLAFKLNNRTGNATQGQIFPSLKYLRDRPLYDGGPANSGAQLTMVHRRTGFPENRAWRGVAGKPDFKLFFSPDIAMANELCSTKDADPTDFKFFRWSTIWKPGQLETECKAGHWLVVDGPIEMLFGDDNSAEFPLYHRVLASV